MRILIAESNPERGEVWSGYLERQGAEVTLCNSQGAATEAMFEVKFDVLILNLDLGHGEVLSLADLAAFRHPETKIVFITGSTFFADGSIFTHCPNACACLPEHTAPQDLAALVQYHMGVAA